MNDYAHNTQFNHWNELLIQKECGNLDFFHCFFSNMSENNPTALMLARSADFWISEKFFTIDFFLISGKVLKFSGIETFPKFGQIWKLFRDIYHNLIGNIHPC